MRVCSIHFSPTGGTEKVLSALAEGLGKAECIDLTEREFGGFAFDKEDVCLIGAPVYGGRIPPLAAERIRALKGNGAAAVLVAVYGNRAIEDALVELKALAEECGFAVVAGVSANAEHSVLRRFGAGRPDGEDRAELAGFGRAIGEKLASGDRNCPALPGNVPFKGLAPHKNIPLTAESCVRCGICVDRCPAGAISAHDPAAIDGDKCASCMRCISVCPVGAKGLDEGFLAMMGEKLAAVCAGRKGNELFL